MAKQYTANFKEKTGSTSGEEPIYLLEITHPQLGAPVRVARNTTDVISNGNTFVAMAFDIQLPEDLEGRQPTVPIRIDNVGRELTQWLDISNGGRGATLRVMQVMADTPDVIEYDITLDLLGVRQTGAHILGEAGFENTLDMPALVAQYRPDNTPPLF